MRRIQCLFTLPNELYTTECMLMIEYRMSTRRQTSERGIVTPTKYSRQEEKTCGLVTGTYIRNSEKYDLGSAIHMKTKQT